MNSEKLLKFINSQIKDLDYKIKEKNGEFMSESDPYKMIQLFAEEEKLKGSKNSLETIKKIIVNGTV